VISGLFLFNNDLQESLEDALRQLYLIDAIDETGQITDVGRMMAGI
jgi:HrpA-like RNA helicase